MNNCHASTVLPFGDTVVAAWFGGSKEGNDDVKDTALGNADTKAEIAFSLKVTVEQVD